MNRALYALAFGNFAIATSAFTIPGLIEPIAEGFDVSIAFAGQMLTVFAIAYAIGSPLMMVFTGRQPRRAVTLAALALTALTSLASALAPNLFTLFATRAFAALAAALYMPTATLIALTLAEPARRMRGIALVIGGLTAAQVVGVPLGTYIGGTFGWRWGFAVGVPLAVLSLPLLIRWVPRDVPFHPPSLANFAAVLRDRPALLVISVMLVIATGQNIVSTYIAPIITSSTGGGTALLAVLMTVLGIAGLAGNMFSGVLGDRIGPARTITTMLFVLIVGIMMLPVMALVHHVLAGLLVAFWAFAAFSFGPPQQSRVVSAAPSAGSAALALNGSAIYIGVALGASLGGGVIALDGIRYLFPAASLVLLLAIAMVYLSERALRAAPSRAS